MVKNSSKSGQNFNRNIKNNRFNQKNENGSTLVAILMAVFFSLGGLAVGIAIQAMGFYASVCGLLIAFFAKLGWEKANGKINGIKMLTVVLITFVMSMLSLFLGIYVYWIFTEGGAGINLTEYFQIILDPAILSECTTDIVIILAFAALGSFMVIKQTHDEIKLKKALIKSGLPLFEDAPEPVDQTENKENF